MSWGGPQQYGGYGQGGPQRPSAPGQYGAPGQAPAYGTPQGYGGAPPQQGYGAPPTSQGYGAPPTSQGYGAPPTSQGYGAPPTSQGYGAPPSQGYGAPRPQGYGAPPPQQGYGAPPGQQGYGAPPGGYGAPYGGMGQAQQPPPGVNPELWNMFQAVDADHSGKITADELRQALMNGNWSPFNPETCRLMIGMFDRDRNGTIDVHEFAALWKYIQDWKSCFDRFDTDRSGNIDANELGNAFQTFGYRLSQQFTQLVVRVFDRQRGGYNINFDDFIQACVMLKSLTDKFRAKDTNQSGNIRISYEEFLEMALDTTLNK